MTRAADVGRAPRALAPRATDEGSSAPAPVSWMKGKRTVDERSPIKGSTVRGLDELERKLKGAPQKRINLSNPATIAEIVSKPQAEWSAATFVAMNIGTGTPPALPESEETVEIEDVVSEVGGKAGALLQQLCDERRGSEMATTLRTEQPADGSQLAKYLAGADEHEKHHYAKSTVDGPLSTAVKHWVEFTAGELHISPLRPECVSLSEKDQQFEMRLVQAFADKLIKRGVKPNTVEGYLSLVRGWHAGIRNYAPGINLQRPNRKLRRQLTGMHRLSLKTPTTREAHSTRIFSEMRSPFDRIVDQIRLLEWDVRRFAGTSQLPSRLEHQLLQLKEWLLKNGLMEDFLTCAALELQCCCCARPGEVYPQKGLELRESDIKFSFAGGALEGATVGIMAKKVRPTNPKFGVRVPMSLIIEQGPFMKALKLVTIVYLWSFGPPESRHLQHLLRFPPGHRDAGKPIRYDFVTKNYVRLLRRVGVPKPELFAQGHAPRIIAATTLCASGFSKSMIKALGRWGSDIQFIYTRKSLALMQQMQRALGRVDAGSFVMELYGEDGSTEIRRGEEKDESDDEATSEEAGSGDDLDFDAR